LSLSLQKGKYWVLVYWDRETGRRVNEYIGKDEVKARERQVEVLEKRIEQDQAKLREAKDRLRELREKGKE